MEARTSGMPIMQHSTREDSAPLDESFLNVFGARRPVQMHGGDAYLMSQMTERVKRDNEELREEI